MLHINQVEFGGESSKADTKFASKVTFRETSPEQKQISTQLGTVTQQVMLNSSSERQEINLKHNETAKQSLAHTSSGIQPIMMPKMTHNI